MASELLRRDLPPAPLLARLAVRVSTFMHGMEKALRSGSKGWFRRLDTTLSSDNDHEMEPVEYLFEAYFFLRKRDGQGSPLPTKTEVRHMAILNFPASINAGDGMVVTALGNFGAQYFRHAGLAGLDQKEALKSQTPTMRAQNWGIHRCLIACFC